MSVLSPLSKVLGLGALASVAAFAAPVALDGLVTDSPFVLKQDEAAAPAPTENVTLEFRGFINTKDGPMFGIFDRAKNTGSWVKQDDSGSDFKVSGYDAAADTVTLEYQGRRLSLSLASAKIGAAAPSPLPVVNNGQQPAQGNRVTAVPQATNVTDQQRLESVAAEVRRRRALRQAAAAQAGNATSAQPAGQRQ